MKGKLLAAQKLLESKVFKSKVKLFASRDPRGTKIHETLANFISCDPELFATSEVFNSLCHQLERPQLESSTLKCLALIIGTKQGSSLFVGTDCLSKLISIILGKNNEALLLYGTMALKNCMLNTHALGDPYVPWDELIEALISNSYSKHNELLQKCSIQALRIISDKPTVKEILCKTYKRKISKIPCLNEESTELKEDLVQWLNYRNFKSNELPKYSNQFI